jgi:hypothetical protein
MSIFGDIIDIADNKHYRGWNYIVDQLRANLTRNMEGIILDTFADDCLWRKNKTHYFKEWVGIIHNTVINLETINGSIDKFLEHEWFQSNKQSCCGLVTLCKYTADYLKTKIDLPVSFIYHPKDADREFDIEAYFSSPVLCHAGFHARNFSVFARLNTTLPKVINVTKPQHWQLIYNCYTTNNITIQEKATVNTQFNYLADSDYISKLTKSVGFAYFYDVAASNAILEHIMTHTPLIVNKHPAVVEYLGEEYPMYYEDVCDNLNEYLTSRDFIVCVSKYLEELSTLDMFKIENFTSFFENYI